jgi:tRNA(Ile)-lysidine synthase
MAMLAALRDLVDKGAVSFLVCLHIDHGLRPAAESYGDGEFVSTYCKRIGIDCLVESIPPGKITSYARAKSLGIEAAARHFRLRALFHHARNLGCGTRVLIAHTKDDMLETALMRVLQGSGPQGLAAMPISRGRILRPLLSVSREEILKYLADKKVPWREDSTNTDVVFLRNRIRHKLIPLLNESFPTWRTALAAMVETQSLASSFIIDEARSRIYWQSRRGVLSAGTEAFFSQTEIIREEALFQGIDLFFEHEKEIDTFKPRRSVIRRFCYGKVNAVDLGPLRVEKDEKRVAISATSKVLSESGFTLLIKKPGLYNLMNVGIEARVLSAPYQSCGDNCFYSGLPLVFRRSFKDDFLVSKGRKIARRDLAKAMISAADRMGTAAFIGGKWLLAKRDIPSGDGEIEKWYIVRIENKGRGGIDVQQS